MRLEHRIAVKEHCEKLKQKDDKDLKQDERNFLMRKDNVILVEGEKK